MARKIFIIFLAIFMMIIILQNSAKAESANIDSLNKNAIILAKVIYEEARGVDSKMEQAAVVWCALNRVDAWGGTIYSTVTASSQFAWNEDALYTQEIYDLAYDILLRWELEKLGVSYAVGRVLPKDYLFFASKGDGRNYFRKTYESREYWDWSMDNPYEITIKTTGGIL